MHNKMQNNVLFSFSSVIGYENTGGPSETEVNNKSFVGFWRN